MMILITYFSTGEEISVRWTVKNHGSGTTAATSWYDSIYWSTDPFYSGYFRTIKNH